MQTLAFTADMEATQLHWPQSLENALLAIELTSSADNPLAEFFAHMWAARAILVTGGNSEKLKQHADAGLLAAERLHDHLWLPIALGAINTLVYSAWGDWQAAREFSNRALDLAPRSSPILPPRIMLEHQVGDFDQGEVYLERLVETTSVGRRAQGLVAVIPMAARISGNTDRFDIAEVGAAELISSSSTNPQSVNAARIGLGLMAVQRSDIGAAAEQFSALESLSGTMTPAISGAMSVDRLLGLLAQTMGNLDQATAHFEDALTFCRKAGYRPELAWTCCDYADTLLQRNQPGDREKAMSLLDESLAISSELGMRPLMERVLSRREILKA